MGTEKIRFLYLSIKGICGGKAKLYIGHAQLLFAVGMGSGRLDLFRAVTASQTTTGDF
jgi:hypothetical protein